MLKGIPMSEPKKTPIVGCKLLREDGSSLKSDHGRVHYPVGEWITVPSNGAYVAVTGGLDSGGTGPLLAYFECRRPTGASAPLGVTCFREVRRLPAAAPDRITPELRGWGARCAEGLSAEQRISLAMESTPEWRELVAICAEGLSPAQRETLKGAV